MRPLVVHKIDQLTMVMREIFKEDGRKVNISIAVDDDNGGMEFTIQGVALTESYLKSVIERAALRTENANPQSRE